MHLTFNVSLLRVMDLRLAGYVVPSVLAHGVVFASLSGTPQSVENRNNSEPVELVTLAEAVEFTAITEDGGGRKGNDTQIGDAAEPAAAPERVFRRVRPTPARSATLTPTPDEPVKETSPDGEFAVHGTKDPNATEGGSHAQLSGSAGSDPNATSAGSGSGAEGVDRRSALRAWLRQIQREVNKIATRNYPSSAVRMRLEGKLKLGITIGADGRVLGVRVLSSSGHSTLDESATRSVMALHIPAPPKELQWHEREIALPVRYALD